MFLRADLVRGVKMLADFNLHFEICIRGDQPFANTLKLVRQCADVNCILDPSGKPFKLALFDVRADVENRAETNRREVYQADISDESQVQRACGQVEKD